MCRRISSEETGTHRHGVHLEAAQHMDDHKHVSSDDEAIRNSIFQGWGHENVVCNVYAKRPVASDGDCKVAPVKALTSQDHHCRAVATAKRRGNDISSRAFSCS